MKIRLSSKGLHIRLDREEFSNLEKGSLTFTCNTWVFTVEVGDTAAINNWPHAPLITLSRRDFDDLRQEPENGIVLADVCPRCEIDVDYRH